MWLFSRAWSIFVVLFFFVHADSTAQEKEDYESMDSLYIREVEKGHASSKVLHAEPLYIDLIRDLGARKGEREWNVGLGLADHVKYDRYTALVEYEWAPVDRLGVEVELPFTIHLPNGQGGVSPGSRLNSLKLAAQYTFLVSERDKLSMAMGYIHEFELSEFRGWKRGRVYKGNLYNPFLVMAKRWGNNFHTMVYTGPTVEQRFSDGRRTTAFQMNTSLHYMIPGTRNFIGVEVNKNSTRTDFDMTIRPQMRLTIRDNLMVGIVSGIPIRRESERFSSFLRLIYEPPHRRADQARS